MRLLYKVDPGIKATEVFFLCVKRVCDMFTFKVSWVGKLRYRLWFYISYRKEKMFC